jgi:hypothetical protein
MRRPLAATRPAEPAMHCHHGASQDSSYGSESQTAASQETSFRSFYDCCGQRCDCCRGLKTAEWAYPAANHSILVTLLVESAAAQSSLHVMAFFAGPDSARAPPRS